MPHVLVMDVTCLAEERRESALARVSFYTVSFDGLPNTNIVIPGGVLSGFEITDLMIEADVRSVFDSKSQTRWFNHNGDLITFDDDETRAAKAKWAVCISSLHLASSMLRYKARLGRDVLRWHYDLVH